MPYVKVGMDAEKNGTVHILIARGEDEEQCPPALWGRSSRKGACLGSNPTMSRCPPRINFGTSSNSIKTLFRTAFVPTSKAKPAMYFQDTEEAVSPIYIMIKLALAILWLYLKDVSSWRLPIKQSARAVTIEGPLAWYCCTKIIMQMTIK